MLRLRLFRVDEQQNNMSNNNYFYTADPLFLFFTTLTLWFYSLFWVRFFADTSDILFF